MDSSRRKFLAHSSALAVGAMSAGLPALAGAFAREGRHQRPPLGLQLYTLGDIVATNTADVMIMLASFGFKELEAVTYDTLPPWELRRHAEAVGLRLRSVHLEFAGDRDFGRLFGLAHQLGVGQVASSVLSPSPDQNNAAFVPLTDALTVDDFKRIAERANRIGEQARRAGLQYAYHNHGFEFRALGRGIAGDAILLRETDPRLVQFEADCGWMRAAGAHPIDYLRWHPGRFRAVHVKDFDSIGFTTRLDSDAISHVVELGQGAIDYPPIVQAAELAGVRHFFVEHDPFDGVPISLDMVAREGAYLGSILGRSPLE